MFSYKVAQVLCVICIIGLWHAFFGNTCSKHRWTDTRMVLPAHQNCFVLCEQHILMTHQIDSEVVQEHSDILYLTNQITQSCIPSHYYYTITGTIIITHKLTLSFVFNFAPCCWSVLRMSTWPKFAAAWAGVRWFCDDKYVMQSNMMWRT